MITTQDVIGIIAQSNFDEVDAESLDPATPLEDQGIDSMDMSTLLLRIEKTYHVKLSEDVDGQLTPDELADQLNRATETTAAGAGHD
jgi:acyl carrier protein